MTNGRFYGALIRNKSIDDLRRFLLICQNDVFVGFPFQVYGIILDSCKRHHASANRFSNSFECSSRTRNHGDVDCVRVVRAFEWRHIKNKPDALLLCPLSGLQESLIRDRPIQDPRNKSKICALLAKDLAV